MDYQHLLVPIDLTRPNRQSLRIADALAGISFARITLLHVIESIDEAADDDLEEFYREIEARIRATQAVDAELASRLEGRLHCEVVIGRRAREIIRYSSAHEVDLIVMASDQVDPTAPYKALRLISHQVSMLSQCPVMLVKQEAGRG